MGATKRAIRATYANGQHSVVYDSTQTARQNAIGVLVSIKGARSVKPSATDGRAEVLDVAGNILAVYEDVTDWPEANQCPEGYTDYREPK
jgi:hypothetical protein